MTSIVSGELRDFQGNLLPSTKVVITPVSGVATIEGTARVPRAIEVFTNGSGVLTVALEAATYLGQVMGATGLLQFVMTPPSQDPGPTSNLALWLQSNPPIQPSDVALSAAAAAAAQASATSAGQSEVAAAGSAAAAAAITGSGNGLFPNGSESAPSVSAASDTNTGMYFPSPDTVGWATGGVLRMLLNSTGMIGIGTGSPQNRLTVAGPTSYVSVVNATAGTDAAPSFGGIRFYGFGEAAADLVASVDAGNSRTQSFGGTLRFMTQPAAGGGLVERMRVGPSGNIGIGTTSPQNLTTISGATPYLSVHNTVPGTDAAPSFGGIRFYGFGETAADLVACVDAGNSRTENFGGVLRFMTQPAAGGGPVERMRLTAPGELQIAGAVDQGAFNLQVNGTGVWAAGAYVNGSDERLKEDIAPLADASEVVARLRPVTFRYKESHSRDQSVQPGFIAQELQEALAKEVYLDGVVQPGPEHLNVAYQALVPILTKALQEALDRIAALEARIG